jgi:tripartite-type tricarboxylate transporter receptor subunit TctC
MKSLIAAFSLAALLVGAAAAQNYPTRPIVVVVPFTAGGPTDALMRVLGERMRTTLGESLLVENVTGAAGTIGVGRVVRAAPNGYTLSVGHWSTHVVNGAIYPLEFDLLKDLAPVAQLTNYPMVLVAKNAVPARDVKEFIAWARANKDKISAGSVGVGSAAHVAGIYFQNLTGLQFQYVSYRGAAPALQEVMAGQIEFLFDHLSHSLPHVRAGKVRAYAVTAPTRSPSAPDIPSCTCRSGTACGRPEEHRRTLSTSSMVQSEKRWRMPACASACRTSDKSFRRRPSKRQTRSPRIKKRRSTNGGR